MLQCQPLPPEHLNSTGCVIRRTEEKGRAVYASRPIPRNTLIEISPVLLFSKDEYQQYGKFTVLDHYTFNWSEGRMALALGLGSIFNHSETPNVTFTLDKATESIRYVTARDVKADDELCIFYGTNLWFSPAGMSISEDRSPIEGEDGWGGLLAVEEIHLTSGNPFARGNQEEILDDDELPFTRFQLLPEEEDPESIRTGDSVLPFEPKLAADTIVSVLAWVVDIPSPQQITTMLKWLKQSGLDEPNLGHLKRIRKLDKVSTLLLSTFSDPPQLPEDLNLSVPYQLPVPISPALTLPSLTLKSALWPTAYTPRRKGESESWSRGKARWAWDAMTCTLQAAVGAQANEELPIAAHIPTPYEAANNEKAITYTACDTRRSSNHPLRHAAINAIRRMADDRSPILASSDDQGTTHPESVQNGTNYLLTSMTMFMTHEPCIMCSMALLHSRVKEVVYVYPMPQTGGCGGLACLPSLKGVNHRFEICRWNEDKFPMEKQTLFVDPTIDA